MPSRPGQSRALLDELLASDDSVAVEAAIARLAIIGRPALRQILERLDAAEDTHQPRLLRVLERMGAPGALAAITRLVSASSPDVATAAVDAMGALLDARDAHTATSALDALTATLLDTSRADVVRRTVREAVVEAGEIILVIAAGGALGAALRQAGMAELAAATVPSQKLLILPMAWAITALVRVAQGSATVAMITAVGIVGPIALAGTLPFHAVYVACAIGAGPPVMHLIRMEDDGIAAAAVGAGATIVEGLDAADGEAQRIGVVPVRIIGMAGKEGLDALDAGLERRMADPVAAGAAARSFKTDLRRAP